MATRQNTETIGDLVDRVDELEERVEDLEVQLLLPWPFRLFGRLL